MNAPDWIIGILNLSAQAALLCAIVYAVTKLFGRWIPASWQAALWFLVIVRLLIPFAPPSQVSLQNLWIKPKPATLSANPMPANMQFHIQDLGVQIGRAHV